jgi:hypothetical protein
LAISVLLTPSAASSTIRARCAPTRPAATTIAPSPSTVPDHHHEAPKQAQDEQACALLDER